MSDDGLDNLFRKGLSERHVKFNMDSWRRMEEMLPPEPVAKNFRFGYATAVIGVLLIVSTSLFVWNSQNSPTFPIEITPVEGVSKSNNDRNFFHELAHKEQNAGKDLAGSGDLSSDPLANDNMAEKNNSAEISENNSQPENELLSNTQLSSGQMAALKRNLNTRKSASASNTNSFFAGTKTTTSGFFDNITHVSVERRNETQLTNEQVSFGNNAFTKISGLEELASIDMSKDMEAHTLVADVSNDGRPKVAKNIMGFIGGVNLNKSLMESPDKGMAGSEFFGIEYQRYLNGGFSLKTNLLYSARSGINSQKVYAKKQYDFGSSSTQTTVECQRMIYLELPVLVNYGVGNHSFMVGPSFSYLVTGLNKVTTTIESLTGEGSTEEKSEWGYTEGFKKYDFSIIAGYEYSIKPKLNVGARLNYGLLDITNNGYFGNDSFDNNVQFRVYLTYSPFQF